MKITKYSHDKHYAQLKSWLKFRDIVIPERELFSDCGFCVDDIAIAFLFKTNSKQAYIDHVAADPESEPEARKKAMGFLFECLIQEAKDSGATLITGLASLPVMKERYENLWFKPHGNFTLYYKAL